MEEREREREREDEQNKEEIVQDTVKWKVKVLWRSQAEESEPERED
jgi:hypothetical protein